MARFLAFVATLLIPIAVQAGATSLVTDINQSLWLPQYPTSTATLGSQRFLTLCHGGNAYIPRDPSCDVWVTDGTSAGTHMLKRFDETHSKELGGYTRLGGWVYFLGNVPGGGVGLWRTDGTDAGTTLVTTMPGFASQYGLAMTAANSLLFFRGPYGQLWRSDGTAAGTIQLTTAGIGELAATAYGVAFAAIDPNDGMEIFASDGTTAGTVMLKDIDPGVYGSYPRSLTSIGGRVYFWASTADGATPWVTDGTAPGTVQLSSLIASQEGPFIPYAAGAYFASVPNSYPQTMVWYTDGAENNATAVQIWQTPAGVSALASAGTWIFAAVGNQLWKLEPGQMNSGTLLQGFDSASSLGFFVVPEATGDLYFGTVPSQPGPNIVWKTQSNGTTVAQVGSAEAALPALSLGDKVLLDDGLVADANGIAPLPRASVQPSNGAGCSSSAMVSMGSFAVFAADDGMHGCAPWRSDGTEAGTVRISDVRVAGPFVKAGSYAYFNAQDGAGNRVVYRTDGTLAGSSLVMQLAGTSGAKMAAVGNTLVFATADQLWKVGDAGVPQKLIDGSAGFTSISSLYGGATTAFITFQQPPWSYGMIRVDVATGAATSAVTIPLYDITWAAAAGDVLVYSLGGDVYRSDGSSAGTYKIGSATTPIWGPFGGRVFFGSGSSNQLYRSDGTTAGTVAIASFGAYDGVAIGDQAFWISGALQGTNGLFRMGLSDTAPHLVTTYTGTMGPLMPAGSNVYYLRRGGGVGVEIGVSNGTAAGTGPIEKLTDATVLTAFGAGFPYVALPTGLLFMWDDDLASFEPRFLPFDSTPDSFSIASALGVSPDTPTISSPVQITGITAPTSASVSFPGQFCISSGNNCSCDVQPYATTGVVLPNQYICVQNPAVHTPGYTLTTTLTVGGATATFSSTTAGSKLTRQVSSGPGTGGIVIYHQDTCFGTCSEERFAGTQVRLIAAKRPGYAFAGWSGDCSGTTDECVLTMDADKTAIANFAPAPFKRTRRDVNGDGRGDLMWRGPGEFGLWLMDGLSTPAYDLLRSPAGFDWKLDGDFDGDGQDDVLYRSSDGSYRVVLNATTMPTTNMLNGGTGWEVVSKGDFNGDGKTDLLWKASNGTYGLWLMNGTTFSSAGLFQAPGPGWDAVVVADFDGDGKDDILWQNVDGRVQMWLMDGFLSKAQADMVTVPNGWTPVLAADLDGDGKADLVWEHTNGSIGLWMVNGTTITSYSVVLGAGTGWSVKYAGDLDGDGKDDLILTHTSGAVGAWLMNGPSITSYATLLNGGSSWSLASVGDFNGDGRTDLVWKSTDGSHGLWLMKGLDSMLYGPILGPQSSWSLIP